MARKRAGNTKLAKAAAKNTSVRTRKITKRQQKMLVKKQANARKKLPSSFALVGKAYKIFTSNWKKLLGIVLIYFILNIIFASGISTISSNITSIKSNLNGGHNFGSAIGSFGSLIVSAGTSSSQTGAVLQVLLIIVESLVIIWALRQIFAKTNFSIKEAYYKASGPLIPFVLIIILIIIQLLPVIIGSAIVQAILSAIFNSGGTLTFIFTVFFILLAAWSLYMISSSIFALYIVTLPDMQPVKAYKSAKGLVSYRRLAVLRRILFLIIFVLAIMAILVIPLILFATFLAAPVFYMLSMLAILFVHSYLYSLYRSLLD